jgi:hypothetical protein
MDQRAKAPMDLERFKGKIYKEMHKSPPLPFLLIKVAFAFSPYQKNGYEDQHQGTVGQGREVREIQRQ